MKVTIVAEIASNWEGSATKAKKIIKECKKAGADAVKFQMWRAADLYSTKHPLWKFIKKSELTFSVASKFKKICDDMGIEFFCSAFYPKAVNFLESINVKRYKIASRTCLLNDPFSFDTLKAEAQTGKPVIISMGMGGNKKQMEKIFSKNKPVFCYCISEYPTPLKKIDWPKAVKFDGFSDHTLGITAPLIYAILKKQQKADKIIIEKHVKLLNSKGPDASSSIDTDELAKMIYEIRKIEKINL